MPRAVIFITVTGSNINNYINFIITILIKSNVATLWLTAVTNHLQHCDDPSVRDDCVGTGANAIRQLI